MTQRRSNTYEQLENTLDEFPPNEPITTHMVINGQVFAVGNPGMTPDEMQRELVDLVRGAEAFNVSISTIYDDVENTALVALSGKAVDLGDLAAFMSTARAASAR